MRCYKSADRLMKALALTLCGAATSCASGAAELAQEVHSLRQEVQMARALVQRQAAALDHLEAEMNDGLSIALCRPELRQMLEDVSRECADASPRAAAAASDKAAPMCSTRSIRPAVIAADSQHKERFLRMMVSLRHEVAYVRKGADLIMRDREVQLRKLAQQTLLRNTTVLIVSNAGLGEDAAAQRAAVAQRYLVQYGVPEERIRRWLYAFPVTKADIERPQDRPQPGEPEDLRLGLWVFRADC